MGRLSRSTGLPASSASCTNDANRARGKRRVDVLWSGLVEYGPLRPVQGWGPAGRRMTADDNVRWQLALKGAIDRIGAVVLLLLLLPTLLLLAAIVFIGPGDGRDRRGGRDRRVLFRQRRVGHLGREFILLKFRTMHGDPEREGEADAA